MVIKPAADDTGTPSRGGSGSFNDANRQGRTKNMRSLPSKPTPTRGGGSSYRDVSPDRNVTNPVRSYMGALPGKSASRYVTPKSTNDKPGTAAGLNRNTGPNPSQASARVNAYAKALKKYS